MLSADPSTFRVTFNIPSDVQEKGFYAAAFATLLEDYTPSSPANSQQINSGTEVYFDFTTNDYANANSIATLPTHQINGATASIEIPNVLVKSGQIVMSVGDSLSMGANGAISTPTSSSFPTNYFALFEYSVSAGANAQDPNVLDIDSSNVDQLGFTFTVSTDPAAAFPADLGIGIPIDRAKVFQMYHDYIAEIGKTDADALRFLDSLTYGQGYRILAPQNVLDDITGGPTPTAVTYQSGGSLVLDQAYNYWITATSASGETSANNFTQGTPYTNSGTSTNYQTINVNWEPFLGATGYKIYRSTTNSSADAVLVGTVSGGSTTTFADNGITGTPASPPATDYTFNSLNWYFNDTLDAFFAHYDAIDGVEFQMHRDGNLFRGYVEDYKFDPTDEYSYEALVLTADVDNTSPLYNVDFVILKPYFSTNTPFADAPPPPNWVPNPTQSPGAMVMANDGVFGGGQPGVDAGILKDLQNNIVSAFNRGIATNFDLPPDYWWNSPILTDTVAEAGGQLSADTYYYVITGANPQAPQSPDYYETVVSGELFAVTDATNASVQLTWLPLDSSVYENFRIYRSTTQGSGYQLIDTIENTGQNTTYTDDGSHAPTNHAPPVYYAPGTTSNWYGAFLVQNITNNPATGVSIRGLAYGFPYGDNNGASTNFTTNIVNLPDNEVTTATINVQSWGGSSIATPDKLVILTQPEAARVKSAVSIEFQGQTANGTNYVGGGSVRVEVIGAKKHKYTVELDDRTGIGSLSISKLKQGIYTIKVSAADGTHVFSDKFSIVPKKTSQKVLDLMQSIDDILNGKSLKKALKDLKKFGFVR